MSIPTRITARKSQPFFTTYQNHHRPCGSNILNLKILSYTNLMPVLQSPQSHIYLISAVLMPDRCFQK